MPSKASIRKMVQEYLDTYYEIGKADQKALLSIADIYDTRFIDEFIPWLESRLTIAGEVWQLTDNSTDVIVEAGRQVVKLGADSLIRLVSDWSIEHFPEYWIKGIDLVRLNQKILGADRLDKRKMKKGEPEYISTVIRSEISAWQDHLQRHRRQIERNVQQGMARGWTTQRFLEVCTCPDGHIIGFMYGNARLSWREHLRRYGKSRPRIMAQTVLERRLAK